MQRRHPRASVSLWAVEHGSDVTVWHHVSNLSRGGLFFETAAPLPAGAPIALELSLGDRKVPVTGRVSHATRSEDAIGMGVKIEDASLADLAAIDDYLRDHASTIHLV